METTATTRSIPTTAQTIDDAHHPAVRRIADVLRNRSAAPKVFIIDDVENIAQAVTSGVRIDSLYATESAIGQGVPVFARSGQNPPVHILGDKIARSLFGDQKYSRVFALAHAPQSPTLSNLGSGPGDLVILDGVRLVGNIGAITRTASALGAAGIILLDSGLRSTLDRRLIRASRGLVFAIPVILADRAECADFIRRERLAVASFSANAVEPVDSIRAIPGRLALAFGGERRGVSGELTALSTHRFAIPLTARVESLNVSVAAGIALYEHRVA